MPRKPHPYIKGKYFVTSFGGTPHRKLCYLSEGRQTAELALSRLVVQRADELRPTTAYGVPSVDQTHAAFLKMKQVEAARETCQWFQNKLRRFFAMFAKRELRSLTYEDGLEYKKFLMTQQLANGSVNAHIRAVCVLLSWAAKPSRRERYLIFDNPWQEIRYLPEKPRERLISDEELAALLSECRDGHVVGGARDFREQILSLRHTTMRPGELRCLKWEYIQWDRNRIVYPPEVIKTRNRREITLVEQTKNLLLNRLSRLASTGLPAVSGYVFPVYGLDQNGKPNTLFPTDKMQSAGNFASRWNRVFKRCVEKKLIEQEKDGETITPYHCRHTRITELVLEGHPMSLVMAEAGHRRPSTTERYTHLGGGVVTSRIREADDQRTNGQLQ